MDGISIIARRLKNGRIEYGWSNGGQNGGSDGIRRGGCRALGERLLWQYALPERAGYLFERNQVRSGSSEKDIFSGHKAAGNAFFYDTDDRWYYISRGPFCIKAPLKLAVRHLDERGYEIGYCRDIIEKGLIEYMLWEYIMTDEIFAALVHGNCTDVNQLIRSILGGDRPIRTLYGIKWLYHYFDDWAVVFTDSAGEKIIGYSLVPVRRRRVETNRR